VSVRKKTFTFPPLPALHHPSYYNYYYAFELTSLLYLAIIQQQLRDLNKEGMDSKEAETGSISRARDPLHLPRNGNACRDPPTTTPLFTSPHKHTATFSTTRRMHISSCVCLCVYFGLAHSCTTNLKTSKVVRDWPKNTFCSRRK